MPVRALDSLGLRMDMLDSFADHMPTLCTVAAQSGLLRSDRQPA